MRDILFTEHRCRACLRKLKEGRTYREVPIYKSYGEDYNSIMDTYKYCIPCADRLGFVPQKIGEEEKYFWSGFEKGIFASPLMRFGFLDLHERWKANNAAKAFS